MKDQDVEDKMMIKSECGCLLKKVGSGEKCTD